MAKFVWAFNFCPSLKTILWVLMPEIKIDIYKTVDFFFFTNQSYPAQIFNITCSQKLNCVN